MARYKKFIDKDVKTAAVERINHIIDTHDEVAVCFSGGKDSLTVLHLTREVLAKRGIKTVNVIFRDEEMIPDCVINFVDSYRVQPWVKMFYYAVPLKSSRFILGKVHSYIQWDPSRAHVRQVPPHAITLPPGDNRVFDQYSMDEFAASNFKGKVAFLNGIRAAESLVRLRSSVNKLNDNYINATGSPRVTLCKPIYDWQEDDVFYYFYENGITYCDIYDAESLSGSNLRVSTPLHAEAAKHALAKLRAIDPVFYDRILQIFPDTIIQEKYWKELDRSAQNDSDISWEGIHELVMTTLEGAQRELALSRYHTIKKMAEKRPEGWPLKLVFKYFQTGAFKRMMIHVKGKEKK